MSGTIVATSGLLSDDIRPPPGPHSGFCPRDHLRSVAAKPLRRVTTTSLEGGSLLYWSWRAAAGHPPSTSLLLLLLRRTTCTALGFQASSKCFRRVEEPRSADLQDLPPPEYWVLVLGTGTYPVGTKILFLNSVRELAEIE